jgi:hypothetical protein
VRVSERRDAKVTGETYSALVQNATQSRVSRVTPTSTTSLEVTVSSGSWVAADDAVRLKLVAQFKRPSGIDIGQEIVTMVSLGKPYTLIDIQSGADGSDRFVVTATVERAPTE